MKIQRVNKVQIDDIAKFLVKTFNSEPWNESWTFEMARERISGLISNPMTIAYEVIEDNEVMAALIGYKTCYMSNKEFHIEEFFVSNAFQNKGYGTKILEFIEWDLKGEGVTSVTLLTEHGLPSEKFYEKNGFQHNSKLGFMKKKI